VRRSTCTHLMPETCVGPARSGPACPPRPSQTPESRRGGLRCSTPETSSSPGGCAARSTPTPKTSRRSSCRRRTHPRACLHATACLASCGRAQAARVLSAGGLQQACIRTMCAALLHKGTHGLWTIACYRCTCRRLARPRQACGAMHWPGLPGARRTCGDDHRGLHRHGAAELYRVLDVRLPFLHRLALPADQLDLQLPAVALHGPLVCAERPVWREADLPEPRVRCSALQSA
jgi:hypothetical protein